MRTGTFYHQPAGFGAIVSTFVSPPGTGDGACATVVGVVAGAVAVVGATVVCSAVVAFSAEVVCSAVVAFSAEVVFSADVVFSTAVVSAELECWMLSSEEEAGAVVTAVAEEFLRITGVCPL